MKKYFLLLLIIATFRIDAQNKISTEEIMRKVADHILETTSFKFINSRTGEKLESTKNITPSLDVKAESKFNKWQYVNGVLTIGMMSLADALNDKKYSDYSRKNEDFIFSNIIFFKKLYDTNPSANIEFKPVFRLGSLDDCGAMAAGLLDVYSFDKRQDYLDYLNRVSDYMIKGQVKLPDSTLARNNPRKMTIWADDLYMSVPFLARMGKLTGDIKYFNFAIQQVEHFNRYLYDGSTGLFFHCFYSDENMNGVAHWGRSNGWLAVAQTELLNNLPANHPKRPELIKLLLRQIVGFSRHQDTSGMWHQLLDREDSYPETSVTAMFTYAVAHAVNEGWINQRYLTVAQNGWEALTKRVTASGEIADICIGTNIEEDIRYYYNRPKEVNDTHGLGSFLLAGAEMIKANEKWGKNK
jgi:unsaturated rhamnogalacturonyl hydrolase